MNDLPMDMPEDDEACWVTSPSKKAPEGARLSVNMRPKLSSNDLAYDRSGDAECNRNGRVASRVGADGSNLFLVQLDVWVQVARDGHILISALAHHVLRVVLHGAKRKMCRVDASRVVAGVHDNGPSIGRLPRVQHVGNSMRKLWLALIAEPAIPQLVSSAYPLNAVRGFGLPALGKEPALKGGALPSGFQLVGVARAKLASVVGIAHTLCFDRQSAADGASAHIQPPIVEARVMKLLGSLHGNRFSAAKPSQAGVF